MPAQRWRNLLVQTLIAAGLLALLWWLLDATATNMRERGIRSGFDFLLEPAGFGIGESLLPFDSSDRALWALAAGSRSVTTKYQASSCSSSGTLRMAST